MVAATEQVETLKSQREKLETKLAGAKDRRKNIDAEIASLQNQITEISNTLFHQENVVLLEAAKLAMTKLPEFSKLVEECKLEIQIANLPVKKKGRPPKAK
jgi:peptidoglycan hydrolase CwlO-like protein